MKKVISIYKFSPERKAWPGMQFPQFGQIYTVLDRVDTDEGSWLVLRELENPVCWHGGWWRTRFRPIEEAETEAAQTLLEELLR